MFLFGGHLWWNERRSHMYARQTRNAAKPTQNKYWNWKGSCRWHVKPGKTRIVVLLPVCDLITETRFRCVLLGLSDPSDRDLALGMLLLQERLSLIGSVHFNGFLCRKPRSTPWPDFTTANIFCRKAFPGCLSVVCFLAGKISRVINYGKRLEPCLPLGQGEGFVDLLAPASDRSSGFFLIIFF